VQYLTEVGDALSPIASLSDLPQTPPEAGIVLNAIEVHRRSAAAPYRTPGGRRVPAELGEVFCILEAIDFRR
jgi:hypothetical protein